jgi:transposase
MSNGNDKGERNTIGVDLGDKDSRYCTLDATGEVVEQGQLKTTQEGFRRRFESTKPAKILVETGTHSSWVAELLGSFGHEVIVADARRIELISRSARKSDRRDAELLARLGRADLELLHPVKQRGCQVRRDLSIVRSRAALVETRTKLVNHVRGMAKSLGHRVHSCSARSFHSRVRDELPAELHPILVPVLEVIEHVTEKIKAYEAQIDKLCSTDYPQTVLLRQVNGVGSLTALCFVLTIEEPGRFKKGRDVGAYLGLVPRRDQSGGSDPELRITKAGDQMLRTLLVQGAHYITGPFGKDSDLRRFGLSLVARGGKNAKKRAVVAVARKLAVLLRALWITGAVYEPLRNPHEPVDTATRDRSTTLEA